jgi:hypothetical protein
LVLRSGIGLFHQQWKHDYSANSERSDGIAALNSANANFLVAAFGGLIAPTVTKSVPIGSAPLRPGIVARLTLGLVQRSGIAELSNDRQWDVRVDFTPSDRDSLMGRYYRDDGSLTPDLFNFPRQLVPFDSQQGGPSQSVAAGWTHTISTNAINELRVSYTNIGFSFGPTSATANNPLAQMPTVSIAGVSNASTTLSQLSVFLQICHRAALTRRISIKIP